MNKRVHRYHAKVFEISTNQVNIRDTGTDTVKDGPWFEYAFWRTLR